MRKVFGALLVMLAMVCQAHADERWAEVSSPHFKVLTDAGQAEAMALAEQFEKMRETFSALLRAHPRDAAPMLVVAVRNGKEFRKIEPAPYLGKGELDLAGYFMHRGPRNYILLRLDVYGPHPYATVYHEYTHYLLRDDYTWMPLWLNEGLAEFYQNTDIHSGEVDLGQPDMSDLMYLRMHSLIPVATLVQITASSPYYHEEQQGTIFYAESWALVHYLIVTDRKHGTPQLENYERYLQAREDSLTAARHAFGSLHQLDRDLSDYLNHLSYTYFRLKLKMRINKAEFHAQAVPETEADAIRAGILVDNRRMDAARALLKSVLKRDPNSAIGNRMMGYLEMNAGHLRAAENWYAGAQQLDPGSYEANYRFAECAMRNGDEIEDARVEASLRKAIALNPQFAPAYDLLAQFYNVHQEHEHEAHMLEAQAISLEPENVQFRLNAAVGLANQQDYANALMVLDAARHVARSHAAMAMIEEEAQRIRMAQAIVAREKEEQQAAMRAQRPTYSPETAPGPVGSTHSRFQTQRIQAAVTTKDGSGPVVNLGQKVPDYPSGPPSGPEHVATGVVKESTCYSPTMLVLTLDVGGKSLTLYRRNYFDVRFSAIGLEIRGELHPCTDLVGKHARITYAAVNNSAAAGQILTLQLSK